MSDEKTNQENHEQEQMSPEQMKQMRLRMKDYYEEQIPFLKLQHEYENLLAGIEEARLRKVRAMYTFAQMMAGPPEPEPEKNPIDPPPVINEDPIPSTGPTDKARRPDEKRKLKAE